MDIRSLAKLCVRSSLSLLLIATLFGFPSKALASKPLSPEHSHKRRKSTPTPTPTPTPASPAPTPTPSPTAAPSPGSPTPTPTPGSARTTTFVISGQSNVIYSGLRISTTSGDCLDVIDSTNVTIENADIGPCGTDRSTAPSNGVHITGGSGIDVYDSYVHVENLASGCCDTHDGILIDGGSSSDTIQGNVIAYGETNIRGQDNARDLIIKGNFLMNPRGPFPRGQNIQMDTTSGVSADGNFAYSCTLDGSSGVQCPSGYLFSENQEDSLNFYNSVSFTAENNYVMGGHSPSGCGLIMDDGADSGVFQGNILYDTGQCGIGVANGTNQSVTANKVLNLTPVPGAGNTAIYIWNQYGSACGPVLLNGNIATEIRSDGASGYWNGGGCAPVTCDGTNVSVDSCNTFDYGNETSAYDALIQDPAMANPPLIPPGPRNCVVKSPYSTQTSLPPCP